MPPYLQNYSPLQHKQDFHYSSKIWSYSLPKNPKNEWPRLTPQSWTSVKWQDWKKLSWWGIGRLCCFTPACCSWKLWWISARVGYARFYSKLKYWHDRHMIPNPRQYPLDSEQSIATEILFPNHWIPTKLFRLGLWGQQRESFPMWWQQPKGERRHQKLKPYFKSVSLWQDFAFLVSKCRHLTNTPKKPLHCGRVESAMS
jgi:hypothetical protein